MLFILIALSILAGAYAVSRTLKGMSENDLGLSLIEKDDLGIAVGDLVKFEDRPVFRASSIIVNNDGQFIIVDDTSLAHVVELDDKFVLWS
jgi:hypothetical protein